MILFRPSRSRHIQTRGVQESSREPSKRQSEVPEALRGKLQMHFDSSTRVNLLVDLIKPSAESIALSQSGPRVRFSLGRTVHFSRNQHIFHKKIFKVHIFWEGHKILWNLHQLFDWQYIGQLNGGDFTKFCRLLRIYEL